MPNLEPKSEIREVQEQLAVLEDRREMMEGASAERRNMTSKMIIASMAMPGFGIACLLVAAFTIESSLSAVGIFALILCSLSFLGTVLVWGLTAIVGLMSAGEAVAQTMGEGRRIERERRELMESVDATHGLTIAVEGGDELKGALTPQQSGTLTQVDEA